jgi:hypothetical protein
MRKVKVIKIAAIVLLVIGMSGVAFAPTSVPEINPGSGLNALALLSGALLVIRGRRRAK